MHLDRKLAAYAAAAAAAGLAGAQSADAEIVASPGFDYTTGTDYDIDFDGAGDPELVFSHQTGPDRILLKDGANTGNIAYVATDPNTPAALAEGTPITFADNFQNQFDATLANEGPPVSGNFTIDNVAGNEQYVGVRFQLAPGGTEYLGWVGVDITNADNLTGRITGFAYQNDPTMPIAAGHIPEPSGLALLAVGAAGMLRRRR